jgi:hypothetical protein
MENARIRALISAGSVRFPTKNEGGMEGKQTDALSLTVTAFQDLTSARRSTENATATQM